MHHLQTQPNRTCCVKHPPEYTLMPREEEALARSCFRAALCMIRGASGARVSRGCDPPRRWRAVQRDPGVHPREKKTKKEKKKDYFSSHFLLCVF